MPRIVDPSRDNIEQAAAILRSGAVVAFPTETVYGLGGDSYNPSALETIFRLKNRPADNPLTAHVLGVEDAGGLVAKWDDRCKMLARRFWPGPLTIVLPKVPSVPDQASAGRPTIAVRAPRHPVARDLIKAFGSPISAPSANRSGHLSPTTARHVAEDFADSEDLVILDGGRCEVGLESTVLDMTCALPRVLRPGAVTAGELREVLGEVESPPIEAKATPGGASMQRYSPQTPAELIEPAQLIERLNESDTPVAVLCFDASSVVAPHRAIEMPQGAGMYARRLYSALHEADQMDASLIIVERPPETNDMWKAIVNRLISATGAEPH